MHPDKDDILTKKFREKLKDYEFPLNENIWKGIESDLSPKKKSRPIGWYIASAAASVALILSFVWGWNQYHSILPSGSTGEPLTVETTNNIIPDENILNPLAEVPQQKNTQPIIQKTPSSFYTGKKNIKNAPENEQINPPDDPVAENIPEATSREEDFTKKDKKEEKMMEFPDFKEDELWAYEEIKKQKKENRISFGLAYGNQGSASTPQDNAMRLAEYADNFPSTLRLSSYNLTEDIAFSETKYKTPVTVGFSVRKNLNNNWALESGLSYTYLETTETNSLTSGISNSKEIQMHYVGIPLKIVYSFYNRNRLSLYASAGGMVEKSVYAHERNSTDGTKNKLKIKEPQWSASGNIGLNYKLVDHLGLFFEPGAAYYFDDKSNVPTIRKDKPFNLNIQIGLRLMY